MYWKLQPNEATDKFIDMVGIGRRLGSKSLCNGINNGGYAAAPILQLDIAELYRAHQLVMEGYKEMSDKQIVLANLCDSSEMRRLPGLKSAGSEGGENGRIDRVFEIVVINTTTVSDYEKRIVG